MATTRRQWPIALSVVIPLFISTYDGAGNLMSVTLFGMNVTLLFELL
jgi:hypothetical protein